MVPSPCSTSGLPYCVLRSVAAPGPTAYTDTCRRIRLTDKLLTKTFMFNTLPKGCTVLPALFTYYLKNPQYLWPLPLLQLVTTLYKLPPLVRSLKFTNHYFWEEKQRTFRVLLKQTCQHPKARKKKSFINPPLKHPSFILKKNSHLRLAVLNQTFVGVRYNFPINNCAADSFTLHSGWLRLWFLEV